MDYVIGLAKNTRLTAAIAAELEQVRERFEATRAAGAGVRRAALSDAQDLEPRAAGGGQGRAPGQGPQPAVRGHVAVGRGSRGTAAVRGGLLRSRRDGEPDQGAAVAPVRRPDQRRRRCAPTRSGCSARRSPTCCWRRCVGWAWRARSWPSAQCQTIRLKLLKIGALVRVTVRKVWVKMSSGCPYAEVFRRVHANLSRLRPVMMRC